MHHLYLKFKSVTLFLLPACFLIALSLLGSFSVAEASEPASYNMNVVEASSVNISMDQSVSNTVFESQSSDQSWGGFFWNWVWDWDWFFGPSMPAPEPTEPEPYAPVKGYSLAWSG